MAPTFQMFSVLGEELSQPKWVVDFLLPNGIMITHTVDKEASLAFIKEELWKKAQEYPLHAKLKSKNSYLFSCINQMAARVQLEDENLRLCDVGLFQPMLKLDEKKKDNEENQLKSEISTLIGKSLRDFDALKGVEVSNFRENKKKMCQTIAKERDKQPWLVRVMCLYPPDVMDSENIPKYLIGGLSDHIIHLRVLVKNAAAKFKFHMRFDIKPSELMVPIVQKLSKNLGISADPDNYCLKVVGRQEYIIGDYPLHRFTYVRSCLARAEDPQLILTEKVDILEGEPPSIPKKKQNNVKPPPKPLFNEPSASNAKCLWKVDENLKFQFQLQSVSNISLPDTTKVVLRVCLYHGLESTCSVINSQEAIVKDGVVSWNQQLVFDLHLQDLPRMARLCFLLYSVSYKRKERKCSTLTGTRVIKEGKQGLWPLAWVNMPVFDFQGVLHTGSQILYMWLLADDDCLSESALNPIGTVECNPDTDAIQLCFELSKYKIDMPICFPTLDTVLEVAAQNTKTIKPISDVKSLYAVDTRTHGRAAVSSTLFQVDDKLKEQLRLYIDKDPLFDLSENDKMVIWKLRRECLEYFPYSLPKVLNCVQWDDHIQVALMHALLQIWKELPPEHALELLDFRYPDMEVRRFAVRCLHNLSSEMYVPSVSVRFGLILEAYCYGNRKHLKALTKQVEALKRMRLINDSVKHMTNVTREKKIHNLKKKQESEICKFTKTSNVVETLTKEKRERENVRDEMRKLLANNLFMESLSNFTSILDPGCILGEPRVNDCKIMDSKMKPLWMVWSPPENMAEPQFVLFKKGDDLRQDMLTLQILRVMDDIWKQEGLDLRLNVYKCMSTGHNEGMIGIVTKANTIANIQKEYTDSKFRSAFSKNCLYEWLNKKNPEQPMFEKALTEFIHSCAGCCVATYVLGIGDRHSDNILLCENGQVNRYKREITIKRVRVKTTISHSTQNSNI
ncbi:hypothetical protein LSH36_371g03029 [Paralvinella palmiformis]|uniref:Phosphatidylinositol-4,5-bisphosphate 3-kinase n=1 Tax=Paralvinella palmiformis TaxID=53620 RepID=A0AAD9N165_9ANNE|nr:hypothetical protein LSH36_371g03029 [Paralvinella palmiformis]